MALGKTTNPMLAAIEQQIQGALKPQYQRPLKMVVHAGLTIMYAPALQATMMHHLTNVANPAQEAGVGAARLIGELQKQSKGKIPSQVVMPAAIIFICEYFDLLMNVGKAQVTPDMVAQATHIAGETMLTASGVTSTDIQNAISKHTQGAGSQGATPSAGIIGAQMQQGA